MSLGRILIIFIWVFILFPRPNTIAQNIALNKRYSLSVPPNYKLSAPSTDSTSLTDGIYTKGHFWTQLTTVGWQSRQVTITIDLGRVQPIKEVTFNTARKLSADVNFPENIFVFFGIDSSHYQYAGDAAAVPDNVQGSYLVKKFVLGGLSARARFISISVIPNGSFIFCDEIEVLKGKNSRKSKNKYLINNLEDAVDSLKTLVFERKNLLQVGQKLKLKESKEIGKNYEQLLTRLENRTIPGNEIRNIKSELVQTHIADLRRKYSSQFILEKFNPWDSLSELFHDPINDSDSLSFDFFLPKGNVQYGAFVITNISSSKEQYSFTISNPDSFDNSIELFSVPFVPSSNFAKVSDPLIPVNSDLGFGSGDSRLFVFKMIDEKKDSALSEIRINSKGITKLIKIKTKVFDVLSHSSENTLNANVWAYLIYPMLKDRPATAANDLITHHINSIVVPPAVIPKIQESNFVPFVKYLSNFKKIKNILIFMNYADQSNRNGYKGGHFMSREWKRKFIAWYQNIVNTIRVNGFPDAQVLLYPYDEIQGNDIADFENLINWAKQSVPGIKFYATLGNKPAVDTLLPLLDVAQIHTDYKGIFDLPPHKAEVWMYSVKSAARSLSSYTYYRLMAWTAFANDFKGIGFWNYADEGRDKTLNLITDPLMNPSASFSVIYDGPGKEIISSRRWEAFRLGIEDYSIITAYSKKFGVEKTKALVQQVLDNPQNLNEADSVRNEMLSALEGYKL